MNKLLTLLALCLFTFTAKAQQPVTKDEEFGKIGQADLEMKACDFEKDANAEVLFDVCRPAPNGAEWEVERHLRIKIFNDRGKNEANVRLFNISSNSVKAETINIENGRVVITPLSKKEIYTQEVNKFISSVTFTMPDVKAGSIIEYKYVCGLPSEWYFQSNLPTRYSELTFSIPGTTTFRLIPHITQPYAKSVGDPLDAYQVKALANIHSFPHEPYMDSWQDNLQRMQFINMNNTRFNTWQKITEVLLQYQDFSDEFDRALSNEQPIIKQAKTFKLNDAKIAYVFDTVRNVMKWNNETGIFSERGTMRAWNNKVGNSSEINLILYNLLHKSGINARMIIVGSKDKAKLDPFNADLYMISTLMVYVPIDSARFYILDASNKYGLYNIAPKGVLNTFGVLLGNNDDPKTVFINSDDPVTRSVFINAEIKSNNKMTGSAEVSSESYDREDILSRYQTDGKKKFINYLGDNDGLQITNLKLVNMNVDSLPLLQDIDFSTDLAGSDENYIFFNPNLFSSIKKNPFINTERSSDIDFGYRDNLVINGRFTIPAGYIVDALPKNINMIMPDTSITFKRVINQQDGTITIRYVIDHKKTLYFKYNYPEFSEFYRKMYEMLNEQIVLKKS